MTPLPAPEKPGAVLSFDFDGTLHFAGEQPPVPRALFDTLRRLRTDHGAVWGINTGRSMDYMQEGILESDFPFLPDWVVAREHEIHLADRNGRWQPLPEWNRRAEAEIHALFKHASKLLKEIRRLVSEHTGAQWIEMPGEPAGIVAQSEEEIEWIVTRVTPLAAAEPQLSWQRNSIYLRFGHRDYQKGSSLSRVAALHGLSAARCFAIGDSHNDLEMLDPARAAMTACPANAVPEIRDKVLANGGFVTRSAHGAGAIEALDHYFRPRMPGASGPCPR